MAGTGGFSGCTGGNGDETDDAEEKAEPDGEDESDDMSGAYDFSSCEHDLNDEKISYGPLDETPYNDPRESDTVSVGVGYDEDIDDDELRELEAIFGGDATHSEGSQSYHTGREGIHKCTVAKLSNREYVEYIVPLPVEEE